MTKPVIAITMGDANGIGPELTLKVLSKAETWELCQPVLIGDPLVFEQINTVLGLPLAFAEIDNLADLPAGPNAVGVICPEGARVGPAEYGVLDPAKGEAAAACLSYANELAEGGYIQGMVSAPLNKEAFHRAGHDEMDELQYLAHQTGASEAVMMGVAGGIWTLAVAEHVAFGDILSLVKRERILRYIGIMDATLRRAGTAGRIAVAALNVHAGEGGLFGRQEIDEITPAIEAARAQGMHVQGPVPADMVFVQALAGRVDGVVFMHHDQANIARKLQPIDTGATIFYGLSVYAATTAHGTAFDKAGQGVCDPGSLGAAVRYASKLAG